MRLRLIETALASFVIVGIASVELRQVDAEGLKGLKYEYKGA